MLFVVNPHARGPGDGHLRGVGLSQQVEVLHVQPFKVLFKLPHEVQIDQVLVLSHLFLRGLRLPLWLLLDLVRQRVKYVVHLSVLYLLLTSKSRARILTHVHCMRELHLLLLLVRPNYPLRIKHIIFVA